MPNEKTWEALAYERGKRITELEAHQSELHEQVRELGATVADQDRRLGAIGLLVPNGLDEGTVEEGVEALLLDWGGRGAWRAAAMPWIVWARDLLRTLPLNGSVEAAGVVQLRHLIMGGGPLPADEGGFSQLKRLLAVLRTTHPGVCDEITVILDDMLDPPTTTSDSTETQNADK